MYIYIYTATNHVLVFLDGFTWYMCSLDGYFRRKFFIFLTFYSKKYTEMNISFVVLEIFEINFTLCWSINLLITYRVLIEFCFENEW